MTTAADNRLASLLAEYRDLEVQMGDPALHADPAQARRVGRRYAELSPIAKTAEDIAAAKSDLETAEELAKEDAEFAQEAEHLRARIPELEEKLAELLVPRDPDDSKDVIIEIKAGAGGEESGLFAGDLMRMYLRYFERQGWAVETLEMVPTDLGGIKDSSIAVRTKGAPEGGNGVWSRMKFEGGVHRVQRVPVTESQGRVHTSAAAVVVMPEAEEVDFELNMNDVRVDVYRSSGPGGQSVNTTDSAVRLTHVPTGVVVTSQNEKSQLQNKEAAIKVLRARLLAKQQEEAAAAAGAARLLQVRTADRSERIRTYNFPQNRLTDHRIGFTAYNLDQVMDGALDEVLDALATADRADRMARGAE
ncbi:peptide chain release factor 1 [Glycomyces albidus]|jgi:peptide chain release factor 1|uniref:Peptide chain release factor 1 n=1 Tax=Glycomyces albidus TaxID=2656774 RepID=A0A6L5G5L8_9ACTN|nr:peptide chain release factor 1 [Glycomyces albidus]MQM24937.1 peptide chain release factor 1 [Glycomyces albidus]